MSRKYDAAGVSKIALANAQHYTTSLGADQLRLLCYHDATNTWSFETHTLSEAPPYAAVSYTWGPNEDSSFADDTVATKDGVPRFLRAIDHGQEFVMNEGSECSLQIDGETYAVSRNVHDLSRQGIKEGIERLVWIDALCINQADSNERSAQVRNMAQIFHDAEYVRTWLGTDENNEAGTVVEMCEMIQAEYHRQTEGGGRNASAHRKPNVWEPGILEGMGLPPVTDERWHILARFFDRRWFHRVWILQEIVMSQDVRFWWGATDIDVKLLTNVSCFILQSEFPLFARREAIIIRDYHCSEWFQQRRRIGETMAKIRSFRLIVFTGEDEVPGQPLVMDSYDLQMDAVGGPKIIDGEPRQDCMRHFANVLETNRAFSATDPRDYIYATLGIIDTAAYHRDWNLSGVVVDYTKSVAEVFAEAARLIMETSKCVNLISLAQDPQMRQQSLPSWVPDFSARGEMPILLPRGRRWKLMPKLCEVAQKLADPSTPAFEVQDDLVTLKVNAIYLDKVSRIGESHYQFTNGGMWEQIADILLSHESFAPGESRVESLWRTLVANTAIDGESVAGTEVSKLFKSFVTISLLLRVYNDPHHLEKLPTWQRLTEIHRADCDHEEQFASLPSFDYVRDKVQLLERVVAEVAAGGTPPAGGPTMPEAAVFGSATQCMYYRRVFLTSSGHLGFGPMSTLPEDEVWLLPGMPLPTILRRTQNQGQFTVLGEAYLHGDPDFLAQHNVKSSQWIDLV